MKNTMKITISLILVITLLSALCGCGVVGKLSIAGKYKLVSIEASGITMDIDALKTYLGEEALNMYIELKADGTGYMSALDEEAEIAWADGQIWPKDDPDDKASFTVEDGVLTLEAEGTKLIFKK